MGSWGTGNFESDTAADHLSIVTGRLRKEIREAMADPRQLEPDEYGGVAVPCNLELLWLIGSQHYVGCMLPSSEQLEAWKSTYLQVWDGYIDQLEPGPEYKAERRRVLCETFDRLLELVRKQEKPAS